MSAIPLAIQAAQLPLPWNSTVVARIGGANLKVLRMDGSEYPDETHDYPEGLLVLEGMLNLVVEGRPVVVGAGELFVVPAGVPHAVAAGSDGTLAIFDPVV